MNEMPAGVLNAPVSVRLTDQERKDLQNRQEDSNGPAVVGRTKPLALTVRFSELDKALLSDAPILRATPDGGFVWAVAVRSEQAGGIRVHINGLNLVPEADLFFFNESGQAFSYTRRGPDNDGNFWTNTVFGSTGVVLLRHYGPDGAAALKGISLQIADVGHVGPKFTSGLQAVTESFCSFNVPCIENASCHNVAAANPAKSSVALMQWIAGAFIYTCTGSLIADSDTVSQIPYFMTANHCISKAGQSGDVLPVQHRLRKHELSRADSAGRDPAARIDHQGDRNGRRFHPPATEPDTPGRLHVPRMEQQPGCQHQQRRSVSD